MNLSTVPAGGPRLAGHSLGEDWSLEAESMIRIKITISPLFSQTLTAPIRNPDG